MNIYNIGYLTFKKELFFKNNLKRHNSSDYTSILCKKKLEYNDVNDDINKIKNDKRKISFYCNKVYFYIYIFYNFFRNHFI